MICEACFGEEEPAPAATVSERLHESNLRLALEQKCIWDEAKQDWVSPNKRTVDNLYDYLLRLVPIAAQRTESSGRIIISRLFYPLDKPAPAATVSERVIVCPKCSTPMTQEHVHGAKDFFCPHCQEAWINESWLPFQPVTVRQYIAALRAESSIGGDICECGMARQDHGSSFLACDTFRKRGERPASETRSEDLAATKRADENMRREAVEDD
jgi:hypothetical protein